MKKGLLILLCSCLLFGLCACTGQNGAKSKEPTTVSTTVSTTKETESTTKKRKTDFRNVCWGDSAAKVKKEEKEELITEDDHLLMYSATVDLEEMYLFYYFDSHDKLYMAQYGSQKEHTSFGQWKKDYDNLKRSLTAKYGKPNTSTVINNVDQDLIDAAGSHALEYGYVTYLSEWEKGRTIIRLELTSQEYQICLSVIYSDKNHKDDPNDSGL